MKNPMDNALITKDDWEAVWANVRLPYLKDPGYDIQTQLESRLPKTDQYSLIEVGCAPGGWMAWFNRTFGYKVSGIEYAEVAASTTRRNLDVQGIQAEVLVQDFRTWDFEPGAYDVVFSGGFIEHFRDVSPVMTRLCGLSRHFVVTIVPNLDGINGGILKAFNPDTYAAHNPIDVSTLEALHARCGMRTLFCDYVGGIQLRRPGADCRFIREHRYWGRAVHAPIIAFNRASAILGKFLKYAPRSKRLSPGLMYIGDKPEG